MFLNKKGAVADTPFRIPNLNFTIFIQFKKKLKTKKPKDHSKRKKENQAKKKIRKGQKYHEIKSG